MSGSTFRIPAYQREYAWHDEEVREFWNDLAASLDHDYFLGLVILTDEGSTKDVVDGQQRLLTLTLLAVALYREATAAGRQRLADRIQADFLRVLDFETEETSPRLRLTDPKDDATLQAILDGSEEHGESNQLLEAFALLREYLALDIEDNIFKRLGSWTDFLTSRLYFAVFVHPDAASAYRVFEIVNTRGRELTTADLLKNYLLGITPAANRDHIYMRWQALAGNFHGDGDGSFVTYIRYVTVLRKGYILPKSLYDYLSGRWETTGPPFTVDTLLGMLEADLDLYLQMIDPSLEGPASPQELQVFGAFNELGIIAARPLLLALHGVANPSEGAEIVLRIVVRRIVAGNLGSGGIERRLSDCALKIQTAGAWKMAIDELSDLQVSKDDFTSSLARRAYNKGTLAFLRRSILQGTETPLTTGTLHFIRPKGSEASDGWTTEQSSFWETTIGNTYLASVERRPKGATSWEDFEDKVFPLGVPGEWTERLRELPEWDWASVEKVGTELAASAAEVWYD